MYTADQRCNMADFLVDNIFVKFGGYIFHQVIGIPIGTSCAPFFVDLFLYSHESEFSDSLVRNDHRKFDRSFNLCYRYIDDCFQQQKVRKVNSLRVQPSLGILQLEVHVLQKLICKENKVNQSNSAWSNRRLSPLKLQLSNPRVGVSIDLAKK